MHYFCGWKHQFCNFEIAIPRYFSRPCSCNVNKVTHIHWHHFSEKGNWRIPPFKMWVILFMLCFSLLRAVCDSVHSRIVWLWLWLWLWLWCIVVQSPDQIREQLQQIKASSAQSHPTGKGQDRNTQTATRKKKHSRWRQTFTYWPITAGALWTNSATP